VRLHRRYIKKERERRNGGEGKLKKTVDGQFMHSFFYFDSSLVKVLRDLNDLLDINVNY